jgi:hypothetical protein
MAYNRINYLRTVIDIQNIVAEFQRKGVSQKWVYYNVINAAGSVYHITYSTFRKYMCVNAKAQLKQLDKSEL